MIYTFILMVNIEPLEIKCKSCAKTMLYVNVDLYDINGVSIDVYYCDTSYCDLHWIYQYFDHTTGEETKPIF